METPHNPGGFSIVVVSVRKGLVEATRSNVPLSVIVEDWDNRDGEHPTRYDLSPGPLDREEEIELVRRFDLERDDAVTVSDDQIDGLIDALLKYRRQVAVRWSIKDVREVRPDLDDDQAWEVLQAAVRRHDADVGIDRDVLEHSAEMLFGAAPGTDEAEEEEP